MQTLERIRKNIGSANDLRDIVRTMRTLAAVNMHHLEASVRALAAYLRSIEMGFQVVLREGPVYAMQGNGPGSGGVYAVVFGSDQGLCGGFNEQIGAYASDQLNRRDTGREKERIVCVGSRAQGPLEERGRPVDDIFAVPGALSAVTGTVQTIVMNIVSLQKQGEIDSVILFHQQLLSQVSYRPVTVNLLPLDRQWLESMRAKAWPCRSIPTYSMDREELFSSLFRQYIFVSLYRAVAESMASENAARLLSMQSAEKNIDARLEELNALYRGERQTSITSELLDIVAGFEALREEEM